MAHGARPAGRAGGCWAGLRRMREVGPRYCCAAAVQGVLVFPLGDARFSREFCGRPKSCCLFGPAPLFEDGFHEQSSISQSFRLVFSTPLQSALTLSLTAPRTTSRQTIIATSVQPCPCRPRGLGATDSPPRNGLKQPVRRRQADHLKPRRSVITSLPCTSSEVLFTLPSRRPPHVPPRNASAAPAHHENPSGTVGRYLLRVRPNAAGQITVRQEGAVAYQGGLVWAGGDIADASVGRQLRPLPPFLPG